MCLKLATPSTNVSASASRAPFADKQRASIKTVPRIIKALEQASVLSSLFIGAQIARRWSDRTQVRGTFAVTLTGLLYMHSSHPPGSLCKFFSQRTHTHALRCVEPTSPQPSEGGIHLRNSAFRGYFGGNQLITPSVVSQSTHAPIHQRATICQTPPHPQLALVSRVLQV